MTMNDMFLELIILGILHIVIKKLQNPTEQLVLQYEWAVVHTSFHQYVKCFCFLGTLSLQLLIQQQSVPAAQIQNPAGNELRDIKKQEHPPSFTQGRHYWHCT